MDVHWKTFASRQQLAEALATSIAQHLAEAIEERGGALLAVSGGSTPPPFFKALSRTKIDWAKVTVTLADERFVPTSSERSNARLVAQHLLQDEAARAAFVGLYHDSRTVEEAADLAEQAMSAMPLPLDAVVLGMGTDGHTASFFPDADNISELLDAAGERHVLPVHTASAAEPRLTLSMRLISQARSVALHIEGEDKKEVLERAMAHTGRPLVPVRAVLEKAASPVQIYWAPKEDSDK